VLYFQSERMMASLGNKTIEHSGAGLRERYENIQLPLPFRTGTTNFHPSRLLHNLQGVSAIPPRKKITTKSIYDERKRRWKTVETEMENLSKR